MSVGLVVGCMFIELAVRFCSLPVAKPFWAVTTTLHADMPIGVGG